MKFFNNIKYLQQMFIFRKIDLCMPLVHRHTFIHSALSQSPPFEKKSYLTMFCNLFQYDDEPSQHLNPMYSYLCQNNYLTSDWNKETLFVILLVKGENS